MIYGDVNSLKLKLPSPISGLKVLISLLFIVPPSLSFTNNNCKLSRDNKVLWYLYKWLCNTFRNEELNILKKNE